MKYHTKQAILVYCACPRLFQIGNLHETKLSPRLYSARTVSNTLPGLIWRRVPVYESSYIKNFPFEKEIHIIWGDLQLHIAPHTPIHPSHYMQLNPEASSTIIIITIITGTSPSIATFHTQSLAGYGKDGWSKFPHQNFAFNLTTVANRVTTAYRDFMTDELRAHGHYCALVSGNKKWRITVVFQSEMGKVLNCVSQMFFKNGELRNWN